VKREMKRRAARKPKTEQLRSGIRGYTSEFETAEQLGVSVRTLRKWRQQRGGPPYIKVGRQVFYSDQSREAWLQSLVVQPQRQPAIQHPEAA